MDTKDKLIEKQKEYIEHLKQCSYYGWNILTTNYEPDIDELESELAKEQIVNPNQPIGSTTDFIIKQEPEHESCDGCQMMQDCGCMLDDSCSPCFEHSQWTPRAQEPEGVTADNINKLINSIYDKIAEDLKNAKLQYWMIDEDEHQQLVDNLSIGHDISTGLSEINNIVEQIEIEGLLKSYAKSKQINLRDELIKYDRAYWGLRGDSEKQVDEYLKQRNNGKP